jgi:hypothetical protein
MAALTEIPEYVHKKPVPMMPLGNTFLFVWALENLQVRAVVAPHIYANQERQLAQLESHDQQLQAFLCETVTQRKRKPDSDPNVIRVQLKRPRQLVRPWAKPTQSSKQ